MFPALENWRESWRRCWAPTLSDAEVRALAEALACDDARLVQRETVVSDEPWDRHNAFGACAIGAAVWLARGPMVGRDVYLAWEPKLAHALALAERAGVSPYSFLRWYDEGPWEVVRAGLLGEASRSLGMRELGQPEIPDGAVALIAS